MEYLLKRSLKERNELYKKALIHLSKDKDNHGICCSISESIEKAQRPMYTFDSCYSPIGRKKYFPEFKLFEPEVNKVFWDYFFSKGKKKMKAERMTILCFLIAMTEEDLTGKL